MTVHRVLSPPGGSATRLLWAVGMAAVLLALAITTIGAGQEVPQTPPPVAADRGPDLEAVEAKITELEAREKAGELDEEGQAKLDLYRQARSSLLEAQELKKQRTSFETASAEAPAELEAVQAELSEPLPELQPTPPDDATLTQLTKDLDLAQTELATARDTLKKLEDEAARRETRRGKISDELSTAQKAQESAQEALAALPLPEESAALTDARRSKLRAELGALEERIGALKAESANDDARRELLPLRKERWTRRISQQDKLVDSWQQLVGQARAADIERQQEEAAQAAALAHPLVAPIAERNVELARERDELQPKLEEAKKQLDELHPDPDALEHELDSLRQKVEVVGMTRTVGLMLRKSHAALPDEAVHRRDIRRRQTEMATAEFDRLSLEDEYERLVGNREKIVENLRVQLGPDVQDAERSLIEQQLREQLRLKQEYLRSLSQDLSTYFDRLSALNEKEQRIVELTGEIGDFIGERILWIRSARPLGPRDVPAAMSALGWISSPAQWRNVARDAWDRMTTTWPGIVLAIAALTVLFGIRRRLLVRIQTIADEMARPGPKTFGPTAEVTLYSILRAAFWPVLLWSVGAWLLGTVADATELQVALGTGLRKAAFFVLVMVLTAEMCLPKGLGEAHFGWLPSNTRLARRHLRWLNATFIPLALVVALMHGQSNELYESSLGRLAYVAAMIVLAVFTQRLLRLNGGITESFLRQRRGGWLDRLKYVWYPLAVFTPIGLAIASVVGYHYTAAELSRQLIQSAVIVVLLVLAHGLLLRWLLIAQQRLARAEAARIRAAYEEKRAAGGEDVGDAPPPPEEPSVDLSAISAQSSQLLRGITLFALLIGMWLIWTEVLPAIGLLRSVELWQGRALSGAESAAAGAAYSMVTLEDLLLAVIVFIITLIVAKNIPGLLEITILQRLPLERGAQFAISTIIRYSLTIIGVVVAFGLIGVTWTKVQWLAAAITVGLGFGLQEIFANFVSGLIILFERPIRVGDTVTVGTVHGTVRSIRIRSTTVMDWDRKEIVIPNKEFVTGTITNWTLSDPILRIVIPVGVAYGSDTALAEKLLLQAARENPLVLDEPPSRVVFSKFGDSSLEFDLRVFIPDVDQLLKVKHELHNSIDQAFRKAGIEIAFPQRDIHIRSVKDGVPLDLHSAATAEPSPVHIETRRAREGHGERRR